jgi:hypothetical protein
MGVAMARIANMHRKWMKEPKYKKAYEALKKEFLGPTPRERKRPRG